MPSRLFEPNTGSGESRQITLKSKLLVTGMIAGVVGLITLIVVKRDTRCYESLLT
jgi:hypothetical protein